MSTTTWTRLWRFVAWDVRVQYRQRIYLFTAFTTGFFAVILTMLPSDTPVGVVTMLLFLDPAIVGFSFVGALVLMERSQNTLAALAVTPLRPATYVAARILTLTALTFAGAMTLVAVAWWPLSWARALRFVVAIGLTGTLAVVLGVVLVARARSMNAFIATAFPVTAVLTLPVVAHFGLVGRPWAWLFAPDPGHAMLRALLWAADPAQVTTAELTYALGFMGVCIGLLTRRALRLFGEESLYGIR